MFRSSSGQFDRLLEKATSQLLLEPDWTSILQLCDLIRQGDTPPKYAVNAIKKKFYHENPHVAVYALQVMESCVKNCGALVHEEVATKAFMEELRELVKSSNDDNMKAKVLEMIQNWGMAFRNSQKYRIVTDTLNLMKAEGWEFPPVRESEAMFEADVAPEWAEGEVCHRCRTPFSLMTRQHHCRACGQVFCSKCSGRACVLPKFGIEKEVRVCDSCYEEHGPKEGSGANGGGTSSSSDTASPAKQNRKKMPGSDQLPADYLASSLAQQQSQTPSKNGGKSEAEIKEEEELQLAIALSKSEAEEKEKTKLRQTSQLLAQNNHGGEEKKTGKSDTQEPAADEEISPELMRYLNRDFWEQKEREKADQKQKLEAAAKLEATNQAVGSPVKSTNQSSEMVTTEVYQAAPPAANVAASLAPAMPNMKTDDELDEFVTTLKTQVEIFVNRMKSNSSRGRSIANDSSVQTLFMNTMAMHSQLLKNIQEQEDKRVHYEGLQDKLTQVKDARAALDALREEERERRRQEAEEAERQRQIQMQGKLEIMRKKKQEYLQYQRQLALQRMQEQEREMYMRQEQAKQQYMMHQQQMGAGAAGGAPGMPGQAPMYAPPPPQGYPGQPQMPPPHQQQQVAPLAGAAGLPQQLQQQPYAAADPSLPPPTYQQAAMMIQQPPQNMMAPQAAQGAAGPPPTAAAGPVPAPLPGQMTPAVGEQAPVPPAGANPAGAAAAAVTTANPYHMQSMAAALPSQPQPQAPPQQQQQSGVMAAPGQPGPSAYSAQPPAPVEQQHLPGGPMQPQLHSQQQQPPLNQAPEAELISFD